MAEHNYKFYLSFENSYCHEYVTEKLYNILQLDMVPVVMGGADYSNLLPPGSFVNARDFTSPQKLAAYLNELHENPEEYAKFFLWKRRWSCRAYGEPEFPCDLCNYVGDNRLIRQTINPEDEVSTWSEESDCENKEHFLKGHM